MLFHACLGGILGFAIAQMTRMPSLCSAEDVSCIRDWLAALSGWAGGIAALIAAFFTVRVILRQIREGREQHLDVMRFQAYEKLLEAEQLNKLASTALGTVKQVFVEYHDKGIEINRRSLINYVQAAHFALEQCEAQRISELRMAVQRSPSPHATRFEVALPEFIELARVAAKLSEEDLLSAKGDALIRAASTHLMLAYEDLQQIVTETRDFQKRWAHITA